MSSTVIGYGSLANRPYRVNDAFGFFIETFAPGAFGGSLLARCDCRYLFNHDGMPLARNTAGTLDLRADSLGLYYEARLDPETVLAADLIRAIERGDVSQNSIGFIVAEDEWDADYTQRTIKRVEDLLDVSAVTYPASPTTWLKLKSDASDAQRQQMQAAAVKRQRLMLEMELLHIRSRPVAAAAGLATKESRMTLPRTRSVLDAATARLSAVDRAAMRSAGKQRRAKLDGGNKTYRSVFGAGECGSERR